MIFKYNYNILALFVWICVILKPCVSTYTLSGLDLYDLTETTPGVFGAGWTASSAVTSGVITSFCDGMLLMGGYYILGGATGEYFEATYSPLPTHNIIYYTLVFWAIDSWDPDEGDSVGLMFDTTFLPGWTYPQIGSPPINHCGDSFGEIPGIILKGSVAHTAGSLRFRVVSGMTQFTDDESFGFRDLHLKFDTVTTIPADSMCAITPIQMPTSQPSTAWATAPVKTCSCTTEEYEYPTRTGHCYACHTDCYSCTLSSSTSCTACKAGKYLSGTQCEPCSTDCETCTTGGSNSCTTCHPGSYLVLGKSCVSSSSCVYPLIPTPGIIDTCVSPCGTSGFLYWDQTCSTTCASQLQQENIAGLKLCKYPCALNQFLYWDGSCQATCDFPLSSSYTNLRNFCSFPCPTNQYLQWDGTCQTTCASYFVPVTLNGRRYCNLRCPLSQYYSFDGTCFASCEPPLRIKPFTCNLPCDDPLDYYYPSNQTCLQDCYYPFYVDTNAPYLRCIYPELDGFLPRLFLLAPLKDNTPTLVVLVRIMQYVRYLNITMPPRLERLVQSKGRNIFSLNYGFTMPSGMQEDFLLNPLELRFQGQKLHSQFFVNFWKEFISLVFMFAGIIIIAALQILARRSEWKTLEAIFTTLRTITQWNFIIMFLSTSIDEIILFSSVEFTSFDSSTSSTLAYVSFISCIVILCLLVGLILFALHLLIRKAPTSQGRDPGFSQKAISFTNQYRSCGILFLGFNINSLFGRFFFLIYLARLGVPMILAMALQESQVANVFLQTAITIGMLGCLIYLKPIKNKFNHFQLILFELIVLIMNTSVTIITIFYVYEIDAWGEVVVFGDIIIAGNSSINFLAILFAILKIVSELSSISSVFRTKSFQEKVSFFFQLLIIPLQQGGMGFESIFGTYSEYTRPTELGTEADSIIRKKNLSTTGETTPGQLPRLANKKVHAEVFDNSDLKSRLSRTQNQLVPLEDMPYNYSVNSLSIATGVSRLSTPFQNLHAPERLNNYLRESSNLNLSPAELPSSSMMDSSFIPLARANNPNLSILSNNMSYDFGDMTLFGDPTLTGNGAKMSSSTHLTPASFLPRSSVSRESHDNDNISQSGNKKRKN